LGRCVRHRAWLSVKECRHRTGQPPPNSICRNANKGEDNSDACVDMALQTVTGKLRCQRRAPGRPAIDPTIFSSPRSPQGRPFFFRRQSRPRDFSLFAAQSFSGIEIVIRHGRNYGVISTLSGAAAPRIWPFDWALRRARPNKISGWVSNREFWLTGNFWRWGAGIDCRADPHNA